MRQFTEADGYNVKDILHFAVDHLESARILFRSSSNCFDSAGYLSHLGLELLLKAWHLHQFKLFENKHCLVQLYSGLKPYLNGKPFSKEQEGLLQKLDSYYELRYPRQHEPIEIGSEDWLHIDELLDTLWDQMPNELLSVLFEIDPKINGGRILMKKKIN
ncbi:MAG: HEPN domain-containing protein [Gallionellaceae bacterium]